MPRFTTASAAALACAAGTITTPAPALAANATYRVVARTGQAAPGGGVYDSFGSVVLSAEGRVAFTAALAQGDDASIYSEGVAGMHDLELIASSNDDLPGGLVGSSFGSLAPGDARLTLNAQGDLAFIAPISGIQAAYGPHAIFRHDANGLDAIAIPGQLIDLNCPGICQTFISEINTYPGPAFNAAGEVAFAAKVDGTNVDEGNDDVVAVANTGAIAAAIREGDAPPNTWDVTHGSSFSSVVHLNDLGEIAVRNYLLSDNGADSYWALWTGLPGSLDLAVAGTWPTPQGGDFANNYIGFGVMGFNNAGELSFTQAVDEGEGGSNKKGQWLLTAEGIQALAYDGVPAPGGFAYDEVTSWSTGALNTHGDVVFSAFLDPIDGVTQDNDGVMIRRMANGDTDIVAREGDQVPGMLAGVHFTTVSSYGQVMLADGRVVFGCKFEGPGVYDYSDQAVFITRPDGDPVMLFREGQTMVVGGQLRTVEHYYTDKVFGREAGRSTSVSELGHVGATVIFTDGTEAVVVAAPKQACVGDVNNDGVVDSADLNAVLVGFGHLGDVIAGDLDLDGDVDSSDLNAVLSNFGAVCP